VVDENVEEIDLDAEADLVGITAEALFVKNRYRYHRKSFLPKCRTELAENCGMRFYKGWAHRLLGEIAMQTNPANSPVHFEKSIAVLQEIKAENELALTYSGYGRFHKQQGNTGQAREYLETALEIFERLDTLIEPDNVKKELAELPK